MNYEELYAIKKIHLCSMSKLISIIALQDTRLNGNFDLTLHNLLYVLIAANNYMFFYIKLVLPLHICP